MTAAGKPCADCGALERVPRLAYCWECQARRQAEAALRATEPPDERHLKLLRAAYGKRKYPAWLATRL